MGRRTGADAFDAAQRELSQKQKKRRLTRLSARLVSVNQKKAKVKERVLEKQLVSLDLAALIEETTEKIKNAVQELMLRSSAEEGVRSSKL